VKFDYGDVVVVTEAAVNDPRMGQPWAVVGMTLIETDEQSRAFGYPVGTTMYTVESEGRPDALVPEGFLRSF
jgi:hypothetical protein